MFHRRSDCILISRPIKRQFIRQPAVNSTPTAGVSRFLLRIEETLTTGNIDATCLFVSKADIFLLNRNLGVAEKDGICPAIELVRRLVVQIELILVVAVSVRVVEALHAHVPDDDACHILVSAQVVQRLCQLPPLGQRLGVSLGIAAAHLLDSRDVGLLAHGIEHQRLDGAGRIQNNGTELVLLRVEHAERVDDLREAA